jgi:hypothetical protein
MRPIRFSALKVLNSLNEQEERGEDDDRQADVQQVGHGALLGVALIPAQ